MEPLVVGADPKYPLAIFMDRPDAVAGQGPFFGVGAVGLELFSATVKTVDSVVAAYPHHPGAVFKKSVGRIAAQAMGVVAIVAVPERPVAPFLDPQKPFVIRCDPEISCTIGQHIRRPKIALCRFPDRDELVVGRIVAIHTTVGQNKKIARPIFHHSSPAVHMVVGQSPRLARFMVVADKTLVPRIETVEAIRRPHPDLISGIDVETVNIVIAQTLRIRGIVPKDREVSTGLIKAGHPLVCADP